MGDCKSCKKDCPERPVIVPTSTGRALAPKKDLTYYLKNKPKLRGNPTPLNYPCECPGSPARMARYTCMHCLRSWARASTDDEIEAEIVRLREQRSKIASERLERIHKEMKWERRIDD